MQGVQVQFLVGAWKPLRAPGPDQALAALVLAVFGGAGRRQQAGVRSRVVRLKYSTPRAVQ